MSANSQGSFRPLPALAGILVLIALGTGLLFAQVSTASMTGSVRDASGAIVPGAAITTKHIETGLTRTAQSDAAGNYTIVSLPVGAYELTAEKMGFRREVQRGIELAVAQQAVVNVTLQIGSIEQQVTVTGEAPLVNTTLSSTSGLITESQVKDMPLNGRSFDQLLTLNTGTVNNTSNTGANGTAWTGFSVAGKRQETNRFLINGVDWIGGNSTGQFITPSGASGLLLGVEAVREYNVLEHSYGAEYGKRAGGQISIVTQSGTNQLHGDVFEYLRNSALDTRGVFENTPHPGPFKRNQFGGAAGGPLKKDKLFLFGNYEGFTQRLAQSNRAIVPDQQSRQGLLPCYLVNTAAGSCPDRGAYIPVPNLERRILPYANTFWPAPNGAELLTNGLPSGTAYISNSAVQKTYENFGLARFDYTISSNDSFSANYTYDDGQRDVPQQNSNFTQFVPIRAQTLGMQETHVFSPTVVNVVTLGYARSLATSVNAPAVPIPQNLVFVPGGNPGSIIIGGGVITTQSSSVTPAPGNNPTLGSREYYTESDDVHFTRGKHSWSAGGWIQRIHQGEMGAAQASAGNVGYPTMLAFLQDRPSQMILNRNSVGLGYRSFEAAWYVQDEIKLLPNLTFRLGLRDEMTNGWHEVTGRCSNYTFDQNFVISTDPVIGDSCLSRNNARALWQPRAGLAWDPTGTGTWAVRAGFGIYNDLLDSLAHRVYANPPFNARESFTATPLFSLIPIQGGAVPPPTCSPTRGQPCSIYSPGNIDPEMFTPTLQEWSFTVERQLTKSVMLSVGYVGSEAYHTNLTVNANSPAPQVCQNASGCRSGGVGTVSATVPQGTTYLPFRPPVNVNGVNLVQRPNPYVANTVSWFDQGTSNYQSLNVSLLKRASHGLTFKANYTYAKVMDLNSALLTSSAGNEPSLILSPYNRSMNRGVASFSLNHQFNANFSYQLPFGNGQRFGGGASGLLNQLIGGWQWNGIVNWQGGFPFTPVAGSNISGTGDTGIVDTVNWNPDFKGPAILGTVDHWFDPRAFQLPTRGTFGNVSRGFLRGPGLVNVDMSLFKRIKISERISMQFRAEGFNIFNHPNFAFPNETVFEGTGPSPSAGALTYTATPSRQLQFALKLLF